MDWQQFSDQVIDQALAGDAADAFTILPVVRGAPRPGRRPDSWLRLGRRRLSQHAAENRLRAHTPGVFLSGASAGAARAWARDLAQQLGGTVRGPEQHGQGLWHLHVDRPGQPAGHIFYGARPGGQFFDEDLR